MLCGMGIRAKYQQAADRYIAGVEYRADHPEPPKVPRRVPLTANQHILHLLLTLCTAGFWAPVWFIRAMRGNPNPEANRGI
jgi:hypothetical protein